MELPVYDITLDNWDLGIFATSLVDMPAIESDFIYMDKDKPVNWLFSDEEKREVLGAVLVPDKLIYRRDGAGREYYVRFTKEVIEELSQKMHSEGFNKYFTIAHELDAKGTVVFLESWIKETEEDKSVALGINEPVGTLFMKVKIESELIWSSIKEGKLNGFSVELDASMIETNLQKQGMDFKKLLKNELEVGEDTLRFNALAEGEVVVRDVEGSDPEFYSGNFEFESNMYEVEDGNIVSVTAVEEEPEKPEGDFSQAIADINSKIETMSDAITNLSEMITGIKDDVSAKENIEELSAKFEEVKLELKQQAADRKAKDAAETDQEPESYEFDVDSFKAAREWSTNKKRK